MSRRGNRPPRGGAAQPLHPAEQSIEGPRDEIDADPEDSAPPASEKAGAPAVVVAPPAPPAASKRAARPAPLRCRVTGNVGAIGHTPDGHRREDWHAGDVGDFERRVVDSVPDLLIPV